jgi:hypothetical protein
MQFTPHATEIGSFHDGDKWLSYFPTDTDMTSVSHIFSPLNGNTSISGPPLLIMEPKDINQSSTSQEIIFK